MLTDDSVKDLVREEDHRDDERLRERIHIKLKNRREGMNEPLPEEYSFDNVLTGVVVTRVINDPMNLYQFEVDFKINGHPFHVTVPLTFELARASRDKALAALYKAMSDALAATFMEEIGRTAISP